MTSSTVKIDSIKIRDLFILSDVADPKLHKKFKKMFPGIPEIILNVKNELISGYDSFVFMRMSGVEEVEVLISDKNEKESLILGFNLRKSLKEFSLFEKVGFAKKIIDFSDVNEIYERTKIGITINDKVLKNSDLLLKDGLGELLKKDLITLKTAIKLCETEENDRMSLIGIFSDFPMSASMQKNLVELTEEIIFRDKCNVSDLFEKIIDGSELNSDKIIRRLKRIRFPEFSKYEDEWKRRVKKLKVPPEWKISHSPFFEKSIVELRIVEKDIDRMEKLLDKIGKE